MEYEAVIKKINPLGRYQKCTIFLLCIGASFNSLTSYVINFIMTEHPHRCKIPEPLNTTIYNVTDAFYNVTECDIEFNGTTTKCDSWIYEDHFFQKTIISKFDIVCDRVLYRAHFLTAHYIGLLVGSIGCGFLADIFGRKPMLIVAFLTMSISMVVRPFVWNFTLVTAMEFLNGVGSLISYMIPFILLTELVGPDRRLLMSYCVYLGFCAGHYVLLLIAYFVRQWELLVIVVGIPCGLYLIVIVFLDESPRWLLSRGRKTKALLILNKISRINKRSLPLSYKNAEVRVKDTEHVPFRKFLSEMIRSRSLMRRMSIVSLNWFSLNLIYYGIAMNVARFGDDVFVNYAASSSAELLAITFCWLLSDRIGRNRLYCSSMILGGLACFCTNFIYRNLPENIAKDISCICFCFQFPARGWMTTSLAMVGKFFATITFFVVYLFTGEMFPTVLRGSALGFASMVGRIGSISSAYIAELGVVFPTKLGQALPLVIYGGFGLLAGLLSLYLPDTSRTVLPENVNDAKIITRSVKDTGNKRELHPLNEKQNENEQ